MAFIDYVSSETLRPEDRVADPDNIIQIHAVHPAAEKDEERPAVRIGLPS